MQILGWGVCAGDMGKNRYEYKNIGRERTEATDRGREVESERDGQIES